MTLDTRTRMFQYKLLNRIVYTNKLLHKIKLSDTSLCTFCGEYEESLEHLFLHCQFSKNFWMQIVSWLNEFNVTIIELKDSEIMLGYTNESPHWRGSIIGGRTFRKPPYFVPWKPQTAFVFF